ncbi:MAG: MSHA biogenesis protein MshJ, partial [Candidatus Azotimanducaceae bacterium]
QIFRHGIQLQLRGDFHTLRRYLIAIEQQPWKLLWQSVRLETKKNGESVMELQLQTLSTDNAWLGV